LASCSFLPSRLLARGLELHEDALVDLHGFDSVGETYGKQLNRSVPFNLCAASM
jgi:hypothetical protein